MAKNITPEELKRMIDEGEVSIDKLTAAYNDLNKTQKEILDNTAKWRDTIEKGGIEFKEFFDELSRAAEMQQSFVSLTKEVRDLNADNATYARALAESHDAALSATTAQKDQMIEIKKSLDSQLNNAETRQAILDEKGPEEIKRMELVLAKTVEQIDLLAIIEETAENLSKELDKQASGYERIEEATDSWTERLTGITQNSFNNSVLGSISAVGGLGNALDSVGKQMAKTFSVQNILGSGVTKVIESTLYMVKATDAAQASFYKATGTSGEYNEVIQTVRQESAIMGVNIDDAAEAVGALYSQMAGFTDLSKDTQREVASFTAEMAQLGVATDVTAGLLDSGTKSLGMTTDEAMKMSKEVAQAARDLGMPVAQMSADLKAAMPQLAAYGKEAVKVFKGVAAAAKATGIATGDLLSITEQFDTFQQAAESVGRLNGILGGNYLNSLEMVNMTEDERIRTLVKTMELSGKNWESLNKYERKAIAASVGIRDMDKANRLLGLTVSELDEKMGKADGGILSKEQMQEMADKARDFSAKLENLMQSLAVFLNPIITVINTVVEGFLWLDNVLGGWLGPTILGLAGIYMILHLRQRAVEASDARQAAQRLLHMDLMAKELALKKALGAEKYAEAAANNFNTTSTIGNTAATGANTVATETNTVAEHQSFGAKLRNVTVSKAQFAAKMQDVGASIKQRLATIGGTLAMIAQSAVMGAYTAGVWILAAAKWALAGGSMAANIALGATVALLLALGVALLVSLHSPPLYIGLGILVGLMIGLAIAGGGAVAPMLAFGKAMLLVGFAVALAGVGFLAAGAGAMMLGAGILIAAIGLAIMAVALWVVVAGVFALGVGLVMIGLMAFVTAPGLILLGVAIMALTVMLIGFALVSWLILPPLFILATIVAIIAMSMALMFDAISQGAGPLEGVGAALKEVGDAMSNISLWSVIKFIALTEGFENMVGIQGAEHALNATANVMEATGKVDTTKAEAIANLTDDLTELAVVATVMPGLVWATEFVRALTGNEEGGKGGKGKDEKGQDILLVMDDAGTKIIAKAVKAKIDKDAKASIR